MKAVGMSEPDDWLEELLGFCEDGSRRVVLPCEPPLLPEGRHGCRSKSMQLGFHLYICEGLSSNYVHMYLYRVYLTSLQLGNGIGGLPTKPTQPLYMLRTFAGQGDDPCDPMPDDAIHELGGDQADVMLWFGAEHAMCAFCNHDPHKSYTSAVGYHT